MDLNGLIILRSESYRQYKQVLELLGDKDNAMNQNLQEIKYIPSPYNYSPTLEADNELNKIESKGHE